MCAAGRAAGGETCWVRWGPWARTRMWACPGGFERAGGGQRSATTSGGRQRRYGPISAGRRRHWDWLWDILGVAGGQQPLQLATAGLGHGDRDGDCTRRTSRHTPPGGASDTGALAQIADARFALRFRRRELPFCVGVAGCGAGSVAGAPRLICLFFQAAYVACAPRRQRAPAADGRPMRSRERVIAFLA